MSNEINIVFITDNNFAILTGTAIHSIYKNRDRNVHYKIFIICSGVDEIYIKCFKKRRNKFFSINIIDVDGEKYQDLKKNNLHVSTTALFKFDIPNIFSDLDKILYVDGDMLFQDDLVKLYSTDLENAYAGVCVDYCGMSVPSDFKKRLKINHNYYFNSGMMLFNLKKMREDNISDKLIKYRKKGINFYMDQDAFNVVFAENVKYLSINNNFVLTTWRNCEKSVFTDFFGLPDYPNMIDYITNASIIHYASADKPSKYNDVPCSDLWYKYYKGSTVYGLNPERQYLRVLKPNHVFFRKDELEYPERYAEINPRISVIIPVYNAEAYLDRTLKSVLSQSLKDIEVICVDDGSTDKSLKILKEFQENDARVVIIQQKNQYAGVARNNGIKKANGDYIVFLDSDDKLENGALLKLYEKAIAEDADIVLCRAKFLDDKTKRISVAHFVLADQYLPNKTTFSAEDIPFYIFNIAGGSPWAKCYKKSFLIENNLEFLKLKRSEDFYFVKLALLKAKRITTVKDYLFYYRINNAGSLESTKDEAPLMFWDANMILKDKLIEEGLYEQYKQSFLNDSLVRYSYNLVAAKSHNTLETLINKLKEVGNEFFMLDMVDSSYYYQIKNYNDVMFFYKMKDIYQYYKMLIDKNRGLKEEVEELKYKLKYNKRKYKEKKKKSSKNVGPIREKFRIFKRRGIKWLIIRIFKGHEAGDRYLNKKNLW